MSKYYKQPEPSKRKILITAGCSFSTDNQRLHTWNYYLDKGYDESYHLGADAYGNRLIARRVSEKLLSLDEPDADIDVVVMFSGISRHHYISNSKQYIHSQKMVDIALNQLEEMKTSYHKEQSQYDIAKGSGDLDAVLTSNVGQHVDLQGNVIDRDRYAYMYFVPALEDKTIEEYYAKFTNTINDWEETSFAILNLQELCHNRNANLFWGNWEHQFHDVYHERVKVLYPHIAWAYDNLELEMCFDMQGMTHWVRQNFTQKKGFCTDDLHPSQLAHKHYCSSIIKPFIEKGK